MPKITALKAQQRAGRVNVYLNGEFAFGLDSETAYQFGLKVNKTLSDEEINELLKQGEYQKVLSGALRLLGKRARSQWEMEQWFDKKEVGPLIREKVLSRLQELDYLDDKKFAQLWIEQRNRLKPRGARLLQQELQQKGIDKQLIAEVLKEIPGEVEALRLLAAKRAQLIRAANSLERKKKLTDFLLRKGYSYSEVRPVVDGLVGKEIK